MDPADIARVCHEANRALQHLDGDPAASPPWDDAPAWQRDSGITGVRQALAGATPEQLHDAWVAHKRADGWTYGPVKDAARKTHPCLLPYADLPPLQRAKDAVLHAVVAALAG